MSRTAGTAKRTETVETDAGEARITWHPAAKRPASCWPSATAPAAASRPATSGPSPPPCPPHGVTVALVEQPWRVAGKKLAPAPRTLDTGWRGLWPALAKHGLPVVAGGPQRRRPGGLPHRDRQLGAAAVLALSFPLHPPGKPEKSRADELLGAGCPPSWCRAAATPSGAPRSSPRATRLVEMPYADHGFAVPEAGG